MARSAQYACQAAQLYESFEVQEDNAEEKRAHMEKFSQALYWKGLNYSTLCRLGGTKGTQVTKSEDIERVDIKWEDIERVHIKRVHIKYTAPI